MNTHQGHYVTVRTGGLHLGGLIVQSAIKLTCSLLLHLNNLKLLETRALKTNFAQKKKYITLSLTFNPGVALTSSRKENDSNWILQSGFVDL